MARSVHVARTETTSNTEKFSLTVLLRLGLGGGTLIGIKVRDAPVFNDYHILFGQYLTSNICKKTVSLGLRDEI